jgi:hypothetical protein
MLKLFNLKRDITIEGGGGSVSEQPSFVYPLSYEEWVKELGVSSKYVPDWGTELEIIELTERYKADVKETKIKSLKKYCRINQNFERL